MGYSRQTNVYSIGEYALRGGILDIFVPEIKYPIRLDFFGTKLEKIRTFAKNFNIGLAMSLVTRLKVENCSQAWISFGEY